MRSLAYAAAIALALPNAAFAAEVILSPTGQPYDEDGDQVAPGAARPRNG